MATLRRGPPATTESWLDATATARGTELPQGYVPLAYVREVTKRQDYSCEVHPWPMVAANETLSIADFSVCFIPPPKSEFPVVQFIAAIYALLFLIGFAGNVAVLQSIWFIQRTLKRTTSSSGRVNGSSRAETSVILYVVVLCCVDLAVILAIPLNVSHLLMGDWIFGTYGCKFHYFMESVSKILSTFVLTAMSFDRALVIETCRFAEATSGGWQLITYFRDNIGFVPRRVPAVRRVAGLAAAESPLRRRDPGRVPSRRRRPPLPPPLLCRSAVRRVAGLAAAESPLRRRDPGRVPSRRRRPPLPPPLLCRSAVRRVAGLAAAESPLRRRDPGRVPSRRRRPPLPPPLLCRSAVRRVAGLAAAESPLRRRDPGRVPSRRRRPPLPPPLLCRSASQRLGVCQPYAEWRGWRLRSPRFAAGILAVFLLAAVALLFPLPYFAGQPYAEWRGWRLRSPRFAAGILAVFLLAAVALLFPLPYFAGQPYAEWRGWRLRSPRFAAGILAVFLLAAVALLFPLPYFAGSVVVKLGEPFVIDPVSKTFGQFALTTCRDRLEPHSFFKKFSIYIFAIGFVLPAVFIVTFYSQVIARLRDHRRQCNRIGGSVSPVGKVTRYTSAVTLFYFFCWTPYWISILYHIHLEDSLDDDFLTAERAAFKSPETSNATQGIYDGVVEKDTTRKDHFVYTMLVIHALPFLNSALNWVFYALMNKRLQRGYAAATSVSVQLQEMVYYPLPGNKTSMAMVGTGMGNHYVDPREQRRHNQLDDRLTSPTLAREKAQRKLTNGELSAVVTGNQSDPVLYRTAPAKPRKPSGDNHVTFCQSDMSIDNATASFTDPSEANSSSQPHLDDFL